MSSKYIVRQPIRNSCHEIVGYEMLYNRGNHAFLLENDRTEEYAIADAVCSMISKTSISQLQEVNNFMTFSTALLMKQTPQVFLPSNLVIQVDDSVVVHPLSMHILEGFARQGYKIAVNEFEFSSRYMSFMDSIHYIKADIRTQSEAGLHSLIDVAHGMQKKCIVTHIESQRAYRIAADLGADYFEGSYVTFLSALERFPKKFLRSDFFTLLRELLGTSPDVQRTEKRIASNPAFSYALLRLAGSEYFGFPKQPATVQQALSAVGISRLKQWAYMFLADASREKPESGLEEWIALSVMRGNFFRELMRYAEDVPISTGEGYLLGMLSVLPKLVDVSVEDILHELELPSLYLRALGKREGSCGVICQLIEAYEAGNWEDTDRFAHSLHISDENVTHAYFDSMSQTAESWKKINTIFRNKKEQDG